MAYGPDLTYEGWRGSHSSGMWGGGNRDWEGTNQRPMRHGGSLKGGVRGGLSAGGWYGNYNRLNDVYYRDDDEDEEGAEGQYAAGEGEEEEEEEIPAYNRVGYPTDWSYPNWLIRMAQWRNF